MQGNREPGGNRARAIITGSDRVVAALHAAGGSLPRAAVAREIAPVLGVKATRDALAVAVVFGRVNLDDDDVMHVTEPR